MRRPFYQLKKASPFARLFALLKVLGCFGNGVRE